MGRLKHNRLQILMRPFRVCSHLNAISQLHFGATVRRRSFLNHCIDLETVMSRRRAGMEAVTVSQTSVRV